MVEDNQENADLYKILLKQLATVSAVENGPDALAFCQKAPPDLIVMDAGLPGPFDGIEALRRLKLDERTQDIPVVVVTGHSNRETFDAAIDAGASVVYNKPFNPQVPVATVDRLGNPSADDPGGSAHKATIIELSNALEANVWLKKKYKAGEVSESVHRDLAEWATGYFLRLKLAEGSSAIHTKAPIPLGSQDEVKITLDGAALALRLTDQLFL